MSESTHAAVDVDKINDLVSTLQKELKTMAFNNAVQTLGQIMTEMPGLRASIKVIKNTVLSIQEGLEDKVLTKKAALEELKAAFEEFAEGLQTILDELTHEKPALDEYLYQAIGTDPLKVFQGSMDKVQRSILKTGVFVGYLPILPLTGPPLDAIKLKKKGVPAQAFAGYTILEKQFVAGISLDYIRAHSTPADGTGKKSKNKEASPEKILDEFRDVLKSKYGHLHMSELAPPISWWGAMWIWMATSKEVDVWKTCTINQTAVSSLKVSKWSFPFVRK